MAEQSAVNAETVAAIEGVLRAEMAPFGLRNIEVIAGEDHDGDPVLFVEVTYDAEGRPIEPKVVAGLTTKLRDRLWELGETRFPHVRHAFPEQRKVAGF